MSLQNNNLNDIYIVDTTLRDGEQSAGRAFSIDEKVEIARYMDESYIYQIEAGIPAMGDLEKECIRRILDIRENSLVSTWNRMNKDDILNSFDCKPDIIHISVPTSDIQIYSNLGRDKKWVNENLKECVFFARDKGYDVTIGFEDASRADINYLINLCDIVREMGVKRVRYADTVGILMPSLVKDAVRTLINNTGIEIEIHAHNDFGMAIPISLEAVKNGAKYVDCTLDGIGERAGNCNLQEFIKVSGKYFEALSSKRMIN
ncbi:MULTISPECIES: isopropylmalate/homocitrate/citramalate synthase [unclassified Clostridium]|uniref:isopropylmalate/homocitrate/citramalate synthase n=1 Tax=unclassified Clostridium TaxID=2614128 RepID=UPI0002979B73|nr:MULTISPECIES: isopropylmalate/homocitrate/citramalate synthase [unclassified Clostridium]EKQ52358.1 MAG: isopropylmalate/homocitrate/citramalate synthase [Clostridium sp. Maddingley MBC34-26]